MGCDVGEGCDQGRENSDSVNSRLVRGPEHRGGTKLLKASSGIQVGSPSSIMFREMRAWWIIYDGLRSCGRLRGGSAELC